MNKTFGRKKIGIFVPKNNFLLQKILWFMLIPLFYIFEI